MTVLIGRAREDHRFGFRRANIFRQYQADLGLVLLIGRAREDHRFGFRRANIFRQYQADLGLVLAALGAQQRHHPKHFSFAIPRSRRS